MQRLRLLFLAILAVLIALPAQGQLVVSLTIKRRTYVRYEPIVATVNITNLSGRDIMLQDAGQPWFGFDVTGVDTETLVPPTDPNYTLEPLEIKLGETVKRSVNLTKLYGIGEYGIHRVKATVFAKEFDKMFTSQPSIVEITEGTTLWSQKVGVPETLANAGRTHKVSVLSHDSDKHYLYVRVEDEEQGHVFCTHRIGHVIDGVPPQMQLDTTNNLYVLQLVGPKLYTLTTIGVNGEFYGQTTYDAPKSQPYMRRLADGTVQLVGGKKQVTTATAANGKAIPLPKISDRPVGLPTD